MSDWENGPPTNILRGIVPTATLWDGQIGFAYLDDGGVFTDDTVDANSAAANDVPLMPAVPVLNDAFYFGENFATSGPFNAIKINLGTAGVGGTIAWEYYTTGAVWAALAVTDATNGFTTAGAALYVTWTIPSDVQHVTVNGQDRYWIRARVLTAFAPIPLATQIWVGRYPTSLANITDGNHTTVSDQGTVLIGGAAIIGYIIIDVGSIKTVNTSCKIGAWSTAGQIYFAMSFSDNGVSYSSEIDYPTLNYQGQTLSTSEKIVHLMSRHGTGRFIKMIAYGSLAATTYVKFYEFRAYEFGA